MEEVDRYYQGNITLEEAESYIASGMMTAVRAFVANGYYLRRIRDEKLYKESGYKNFKEYLEDRYKKDEGWASKCIKVNQQLSVGGNSPILDSKYCDYNDKYKLVELAAMTEEQRSQVSPDMSVKALREFRKGDAENLVTSQENQANESAQEEVFDIREVSTVETPEPEKLSAYGTSIKVYPEDSLLTTPGCEGGHDCFLCHLQCDIRQEYCQCVEATTGNPFPCDQIDRIDTLREEIGERCQFIDLNLAYHRAGDHEPVPCCKECKEPCQYACERSIQKREAVVPKLEPEPEPRAWNIYATPCIHRSGFSCTVPDDKKNVPGDGSNCKESCCWNCTRHGECKLECNCSASRPEEPEPEPVEAEPDPVIDAVYEELPDPAEELRQIGELDFSCRTENILKRAGIDTVEGLTSMSEEELTAVRGMSNRVIEEIREKLNDVDTGEKPEPEESTTDLQVVRQMLEKENRLLNTCLLTVPDPNNIHIRKMKLRVAALAAFVCDLDNIENPLPKPEQPELPLLKNNDQRKFWIENYKAWGMWYRDENIDVNYYKYDFADGSRLIAAEYPQREFYWSNEIRDEVYYHLVEKRKEKYNGLGTYDEKYQNSTTSVGEIVEYLKEIQKKGEVKNQW